MLEQRRELRLQGTKVAETPLLVPAFSSLDYSDLDKILEWTRDSLPDCLLISAYDYHYQKLGPDPDLSSAKLVFLDSGGYEQQRREDVSDLPPSRRRPNEWTQEMLVRVIADWPVGPGQPPTVVVSYDHPHEPLARQVEQAKELFAGRADILTELLVKPQSTDPYVQMEPVIEQARLLAQFDAVGFTENELADSILERMLRIARLRTAMHDAGISTPIHILGGLDTLSTPLYYMAGADIFDGLSWVRYAYRDGLTIYWRNCAILDGSIQRSDSRVRRSRWNRNLSALEDLRLTMRAFTLNRDFNMFGAMGDRLKDAYDRFCGELGREP